MYMSLYRFFFLRFPLHFSLSLSSSSPNRTLHTERSGSSAAVVVVVVIMRFTMKGGVWKNTEDEVLKAAVMKYGMNQWSRISSLLVRKSAKQCKARWFEWLDPSIVKTEWTREEDEKLLHLAKLMPTQWRTIAPIVGRTSAQCLERYEKLLDAAMAGPGAAVSGYDARDDPRRLRPGEIDPAPETKPARPDPMDMDEDEKEMLSEARARLANTKGRKAKRKSRERLLEEAKRLASMQKKRELQAAGIDMMRRKRTRGIDYSKEIAFEHRPAQGFFNTAEEDARMLAEQEPFRPVNAADLEAPLKRHQEEKLRKIDIAKEKMRERKDGPGALAHKLDMNGTPESERRSKLKLPVPQVSDAELYEIARVSGSSSATLSGAGGAVAGGGGVTGSLIGGHYMQTPLLGAPSSSQIMTPSLHPTPMRTPSGRGDAIMMEAENLARMRAMETPVLKGGEGPVLHPSDFSGATPRSQNMATPSMFSGATTPGGMTTPSQTPLFGGVGSETPSAFERHRQKELRANLRHGLLKLPVAKNEYQVVVPDIADMDTTTEKSSRGRGGTAEYIEDAADVEKKRQRREEALMDDIMARRSQVVRRGLPVPASIPASFCDDVIDGATTNGTHKNGHGDASTPMTPDALIKAEMVRLIRTDIEYGTSGGAAAVVGEPSTRQLEDATLIIEEERIGKKVVETPSLAPHGTQPLPIGSDRAQESLAAVRMRHACAMEEVVAVERRIAKLKQRCDIVNGGLQKRSKALASSLTITYEQTQKLISEYRSFQRLRAHELRCIPQRKAKAEHQVAALKKEERELQRRYGDLLTALRGGAVSV